MIVLSDYPVGDGSHDLASAPTAGTPRAASTRCVRDPRGVRLASPCEVASSGTEVLDRPMRGGCTIASDGAIALDDRRGGAPRRAEPTSLFARLGRARSGVRRRRGESASDEQPRRTSPRARPPTASRAAWSAPEYPSRD